MTWREYHNATKHTPESLRRNQRGLDWANMPDPFRHYEGVPVLDLPADPDAPLVPLLELLQGVRGATGAADGAAFLSQLLFYTAAVSASKVVPATGYRYALRVNPSSGNLHPTEFHCWTRGLREWPDGLYHYRPSSHMMEQRALGHWEDTDAPLLFVLTSIAWREAWKYGDRAYRYCLHDIGHAAEALTLAARSLGCDATVSGEFADAEVACACGLHHDEWPMLLVALRGAAVPTADSPAPAPAWYGGIPNALSRGVPALPVIEAIHAATTRCTPPVSVPAASENAVAPSLPPPAFSPVPFGYAARTRRSALDFEGGERSLSLAELSTLLHGADVSSTPFVRLYLYVHRVDGLAPGVYRHWSESGRLELIREGDQRVVAAGLSLRQDLAGNACVAFSLIANLENAAAVHGDRGYRYAHFQAGAIGQRLYLAAEALGLRATGIGAFFDDEVNSYLGLTPAQGEVIYHFAIGYPVPDPRLSA